MLPLGRMCQNLSEFSDSQTPCYIQEFFAAMGRARTPTLMETESHNTKGVCHNKVTPTRNLTTGIYCLVVLKVTGPKPRCLQGNNTLSEVLRKDVLWFSASQLCWLTGALLQPPHHVYLWLFTLFSCLCIQITSFYKDTSDTGLRPTLMTSFQLNYLYKDPISM